MGKHTGYVPSNQKGVTPSKTVRGSARDIRRAQEAVEKYMRKQARKGGTNG